MRLDELNPADAKNEGIVEYSLPIVPIVPKNDEKGNWKHDRAVVFMNRLDSGNNAFHQWLEEMLPILQKSPFLTENQNDIAKAFGCESAFNDALELAHQLNDHVTLNKLQRYRLLVSCVVQAKQVRVLDKKENEINVFASAIEGNNRMWSLVHILHGAEFDPTYGVLTDGTLSWDWLTKHICGRPDRSDATIKVKMNAVEESITLI